MDINFKHKKLAKILNSARETIKEFGEVNGRKIMQRLSQLKVVDSLDQISHVPPARLHELSGERRGQFAIDVKQPCRIIFVPDHDPVPLKDDGGIDLSKVTKILILAIANAYH